MFLGHDIRLFQNSKGSTAPGLRAWISDQGRDPKWICWLIILPSYAEVVSISHQLDGLR
jgi:hypothetical protein